MNKTKTIVHKSYELTILDGTRIIFQATFAPVFPHVKSIYSAILESKSSTVQCLINKLNQKDWEQVGETSWRQALIANKTKYVLVINELPGIFFATVPMCLYAYN